MANNADSDQLASSEATDLDLHCLQRQGISGFNRTRGETCWEKDGKQSRLLSDSAMFAIIPHSVNHITKHSNEKNVNHYENMPIQIYWKFYHQKRKKIQIKKKSDIFHISAQNIDCGYALEPPRSRNKKINVYPCKPQFYYIKVGFKGVETI